MSALASIQAWMQSAIAAEDMPDDEAGAHLLPSSRLPPEGRLAIHRRGYRARLVRCLRDELPLLRAALDDEVFDLFALDYLAKHPPASYTLDELDRRFADFLREERPDRDDDAREWWPDLMIDLARLDRLTRDVFDGPGAEDRQLLDADAIDAGTDLRAIAPVPHRRETFGFELLPFVAAVRRGEARPALPRRGAQALVIYRRAFVVHHRATTEREWMLIAALEAGSPVDAAREIEALRALAAAGLLLQSESTDPDQGAV